MKFLSALFILHLGLTARVAPAKSVDYLKEIKPVLVENCYKCHGASAQKGGLRLDTAASAIKAGDPRPAVLPGKGSASLLVKALRGTAEDMHRMPLKKPPLPDQQIALIQAW